uniref:Uncharacterized protein n=1 Tax=uncultured Chloroflexota bacterium TaxID=166587 RepID=H5SQ67_9CHLR|nr:hypothetical protein HGMM_F55G01C31 [uncultured Chloroflexota bacterium]
MQKPHEHRPAQVGSKPVLDYAWGRNALILSSGRNSVKNNKPLSKIARIGAPAKKSWKIADRISLQAFPTGGQAQLGRVA